MNISESTSQMKNESKTSDGLDTPIQFCPGVGPNRAGILRKLNIETVRDLFWHLPRGYEDYHNVVPIAHLRSGQTVSVLGTVTFLKERTPKFKSKVRYILQAQIQDQSGALLAVWFNQPFLMDKIHEGTRLILHGKVDLYDGMIQMSSPKFQVVDAEQGSGSGIVPIYSLSEGLTQGVMRLIVRKAFERFASQCLEIFPQAILDEYSFPQRFEAFRILHFPKPKEGAPSDTIDLQGELFEQDNQSDEPFALRIAAGEADSIWEKARQRLVFEEFFLHQFILRRFKGHVEKQAGISHPTPKPDPWEKHAGDLATNDPLALPALFIKHLPFSMTKDQKKVCHEIEKDMISSIPMNRLLQGDVGSGKTVVSFYAMMLAAAGGRQAAMMAPTELLAQQHLSSLQKFTQQMPHLTSVILTGRAKAKERKEVLEAIAAGEASFIVGTHALFQEQVRFANLGLVVVDEQHKFGVDQRQKLIDKGLYPDLLVATATPIPRTLSLTLFGDMDVSVIASLPPNRPPLKTRWTQWEKEDKVWQFVDEAIERGEQAYVVCPIIEPSANSPHLPSTEEAFERLVKEFLPHRRIVLLHGKHGSELKSELMDKLRKGEVDIVVATTVIEVGVDLPNATIMVILGADRFGLAQLHQLRGRVGRGHLKSYCILVTSKKISITAKERMKVMEKTRNGFEIADKDLEFRGPGDQFGTRQSGHLKFRLADPAHDNRILQKAHELSLKIYEQDPDLHLSDYKNMKKEIKSAFDYFEFRRPS